MKKDEYDVIIIGAGIGGLVCGCYVAKSDLKVLIVEQNDKPGGYCTSFEENGYKFDVGVHYLGSCRENNGMIFNVLKDFSLLGRLQLINNDPYDKIQTPNETIFISKNYQKTIQALSDYFPKERENLKRFFQFILNENILVILSKTKRLVFGKFLDSLFKDSRLKSILSIPLGNLGLPPSRASAFVAIMLYREYVLDGGYYPKGGIQKFPDLLASRFKEFGGELRLSTRAKSIRIRNQKVTGLDLDNKEVVSARVVVANSDASETFEKLLSCDSEEKEKIKKLEISASAFVAYLGLRKKIDEFLDKNLSTWLFSTYNIEDCYDMNKYYNLEEKLKNREDIDYIVCQFPSLVDADLSAKGKSLVRAMIWVKYANKNLWDDYKEKLYDKVLNKISSVVPNIKELIEIKKIATPLSFYKHTSNKNGAIFGWASTVRQANRNIFPCKTSIEGLYLTGSWVTNEFGQCGIPIVVLSGKNTAKAIYKDCRI